jgi:adenylate cyclase class 2
MAAYEVEAKFPLHDVAAVRSRLLALGAVAGMPLEQCDTYFAHPVRDFASTDEAFRLRRVGEANALTYKGPLLDRQTKTRQEIEVAVEPGRKAAEQMTELLQSLGFRTVRAVEKTRVPHALTWRGHQFEVALDSVRRLGEFLELELLADEAHWQEARDVLLELAGTLGLSGSERRSYLQLLLEQERNEA